MCVGPEIKAEHNFFGASKLGEKRVVKRRYSVVRVERSGGSEEDYVRNARPTRVIIFPYGNPTPIR